MKTKLKIYILLALIIFLGLFLRVYNINHAPPGVYPDEAVNGMDAVSATSGNWQWFYEANNGREGLFINLIALGFKFFGISVLTLRLPSIIFGTLAILGIYLLAKELFRKEKIALISSFLVAVSFWAINFSRIAFRAIMMPAILAFAFYFLFRGMRTKKISDFVIGGLVFGLGFHTYIAFRIAPLILLVMLITFLFTRPGFLKNYWKKITVFVAAATLVVLPMLYTFYFHPEYLQSRAGNISVLNPEINHEHLVKTFLKSFSLSLAKYNFWGDQNWRHNYPPYPILDPIAGLAFMIGLIYSLGKTFHLLIKAVKDRFSPAKLSSALDYSNSSPYQNLEIWIFLTAWFFVMLVPEFMTAEGNPHALRSIGTLPVAFIFSAVAFDLIFKKSQNYSAFFKKLLLSLIITMVTYIGLFNIIKYHVFWGNKIETARSFEKNLMDISNYLKTLPSQEEKFVVAESMQRIPIELFNSPPHQNALCADPKTNDYKNKIYQSDTSNTNLWCGGISYIYSGQIDQINPSTGNFEIIFTNRDNEAISYLQNKFPGLKLEEKKDSYGISFYVLK